MSLRLTSVEMRDFRNYENGSFEIDPSLTILSGPNGVGKTNMIEAVQILLSAESFRRPAWEDLVRWGAEEARLAATLEEPPRRIDLETSISPAGRRTARLNGSPVRRKRDLREVMPCVAFTPDDLQMVKGPAEGRRAAIDGIGDRLSATYETLRQEYERTLRQRNRALRDGAAEPVLDALSEAVASTGATLVVRRMRLLARMGAAAGDAYTGIAEGQALSVAYVPSWSEGTEGGTAPEPSTVTSAIGDALRRRSSEERARGLTLTGPHRDDIAFLIDGRDARAFGSQGQQRSITLAWKLAEVAVAEEVAGKPPLLLLDDVMSELDQQRRHSLTAIVGTRVQTLATTTNLDYFEPETLERALVIGLGS